MDFETQNKTISHVGPKDFFLNLAWLISLYGTIISFIALSFGVINKIFVDPTTIYDYAVAYTAGIRIAISWLVVIFPLFLVISHFLRKMFVSKPELRDLWIRKWLIFLTLFLSSATLIIDLIITINAFLGGELTNRFFAKAGVVFVVAGLALYYYLKELKTNINMKVSNIFSAISIVLVLGVLIMAFTVIGSPMNERLRKSDDTKIQNLQDINWQIQRYYDLTGTLPNGDTWEKDLSESLNIEVPVDPETSAHYLYKPDTVLKNNYTVCANFNLERPATYVGDTWAHKIGEACFKQIISIEGTIKPGVVR